MLDSLLELQTTLMNANAETKSAVLRRKRELGDGGGAEGESSDGTTVESGYSDTL